ncbi:PREDICTED: eukaryotic translation initiation [Prunus dulcis]|uniref:PREDICTED: eukaryotic translation initiation n=1 Tax=Prunus dulcis TaxID=3755 RepID=A0A5E4G659_PRUDU|nr:PREDICTED: eukaryotic translation initiation [Prunus dulcis]
MGEAHRTTQPPQPPPPTFPSTPPSPHSPAPRNWGGSPTGPEPSTTQPSPRTCRIQSSTSRTTSRSLPPPMTTPHSISLTESPRRTPGSAPNSNSSSSGSCLTAAMKNSKPKSGSPRRSGPAIPFSTFSKLSVSVPKPEDLLLCNGLEFYDQSCDRITPKNERRLEHFNNRNLFKVTTTDDPVIHRLANEDKATVFAIDTILSTLMYAPRSIYSWDIVVQRVGNKLFFFCSLFLNL